ncbi:MAG: tyrosine-type recombinase/integrase [Pseudomonadota bacterium]
MAEAIELPKGEARALIKACFADLASRAQTFAPRSSDPMAEVSEQRHWAQESVGDLERQVSRHQFEPWVEEHANRFLRAHGLASDQLNATSKLDVISGVARALAEEQRLFLYRLEERLLPYQVQDPLFEGVRMRDFPPAAAQAAVQDRTTIGPTLTELAAKYFVAKKRSWVGKTHANRTRQIEFLIEHIGADVPASEINAGHLRGYRDAVQRLRRNHHVGAAKAFSGRQTDDESARVSAKTASLLFETAKAFFNWAKAEGYVAENPATGLRVEMPKASKSRKARRPFRPEELDILFSAPVFTGCKSVARRHDVGPKVIRDAHFWIPLIAFVTGARLGEIVQLHVGDVHLSGPVPFIEITDEDGGALGSGEEKHVKSTAGMRKVPIHPDLLAAGFGDFVAKRADDRRASKRLFYEVAYGADGVASTVFSKWFARLMDKVGLSDPTLVFHSFRHNAEDALRNARQPQYVIDRIIGHSDGATSSLYGEGVSLQVMSEAIGSLAFTTKMREALC